MTVLDWERSDDRKAVTATLRTTLRLEAQQIEELMNNLGAVRSTMLPPVAADWPGGQKFQAIQPGWHCEPEIMEGNSVIHIRDPRFGWLHYVLSRNDARKLGKLLIAQADARHHGPQRGRPS